MPRLKPSTDARARVCRRAIRDERGSASVEFITLGVLLLVPLAYLMLSLASIQSAALCAEAAARNAGRLLAEDAVSAEAIPRAETALAFALADHGLPAEGSSIRVSCLPEGKRCTDPEALVSVEVTVQAPLPLIPDFLDPQSRASIPVQATSAFPVGRFGDEGQA